MVHDIFEINLNEINVNEKLLGKSD